MDYVKVLEPDQRVCDLLMQVIGTTADRWKTIKSTNPYSKAKFQMMTTIPGSDIAKVDPTDMMTITTADDPRIVSACSILGATSSTNALVYPKNCVMGWHTNSNNIGTRIYYTYNIAEGIFRYHHPDTKEIIDSYDKHGWTCRSFVIDDQKPLWHTVWTDGIRFSFGFNIV